MKGIQTKLTVVTVFAVTILTVVSILLGVVTIRNVGKRSTGQMLVNLCEAGEKNLDFYFTSVEQSVDMIAAFAESDLKGAGLENLPAHLDRVRPVFSEITNQTQGVLTYYYRIDPVVSDTAKGFWYTDVEGSGFAEHEVTDITLYDTMDTSALVWFTVPKATGKAVWLPPYITDNLDVRVISYNVPIYLQDLFIGVIGIEIDYSTMAGQVNNISLYENGYAFLTDAEGVLIYHPRVDVTEMENPPDVPEELKGDETSFCYTFDGVKKLAVREMLENGMRLYVSVPLSEAYADLQRPMLFMILGSLLLFLTVIILSVYTVRIIHRQQEEKELRVKLEKEARSVKELTELMGSMSTLLSNMPAMSFSKDAETGVYLACNQAFAEYAGKSSPEEVVGLTDYQLFDQATADHFVEDDKKALAMDGAYIFFEDVPDATESIVRNLQTTKRKIQESSGRTCLLGLCVDVTETTRAKAEEAANKVREQEKREKEAMEAFYRKDLERLSYQASHDELTGLYNRFGYDFVISEHDFSAVHLIMMDTDDFKSINDNFGHEVGDEVLKKIAGVLRKNFRGDDCVCRIGGDEFVVLMVHSRPELRNTIIAKIEKINRELSDTSDGLPPVSISAGIAYGREATDAIDLLKLADLAMYEIKRRGKHGYFFSCDSKEGQSF